MKLFVRQRTERARQVIDDWAETGQNRWMSALMYLCSGQPERALSEGQRCLTASEKIQGDNAQELACGLAVLKLIYTDMERPEEAASIDERFASIRDQIGDVPISRTMIEALYDLAVVHQGQDDPKSNQRAFLTGMTGLSLLVLVHNSFEQPELMDRFYRLFQSLGFPPNGWGWLTRRCDFRATDPVGLVSVLIDEGMFPSETNELPDLSQSDPIEGQSAKDYSINRLIEQSWMSSGFSEDFPMSVADGELSMRVERLFEECGRCLRYVGGLSAHVLLFSSHSTVNHIAVIERDTSSDEKSNLCDLIVGGLLAERGADSVMVVTWTNFTLRRRDKSLIPALQTDADIEISIEARDSKSYISGTQSVRRTLGRWEFHEPVLSEAEDGCLYKFTFPVEPLTEEPQQETDPDEAEKTP
jgi:hypothetical protein